MWSERKQLGMLRCSQQVAEHSATGTCIPLFLSLVFFLSSLLSFCMFTDLSITLVMTICYRAWRKAHACRIPPKLTLFLSHTHTHAHTHTHTLLHTHTHTEWRGASAACIFSLLLYKGCPNSSWQGLGEPREHHSTHTHTHTQWNVPRRYPFTHRHVQENTHQSWTTHTATHLC